jgi:hypothetical protein
MATSKADKPRVGRTPEVLRKGGAMTDRKKEAAKRSTRKFKNALKELKDE